MQSDSVARIHDRRPRPARAPQAPPRLRLARDRTSPTRPRSGPIRSTTCCAAPTGRCSPSRRSLRSGVPRPAHLRGQAPGAGRRRDRRDHPQLRRTRRCVAPQGEVPRPRLRPRAGATATAGCGSSTGSSTTTTTSSCSARWPAAASTRATGSSSSSGSARASSPSRPSTASTSSPRAAPWADVRKAGANTPLVYVARGSHANYFRAGSHWTGVWWDQADGRGPQITPTLEVLEDRDAGLGALAGLVGRHEGRRRRRWTRRARAARGAARTGTTRRAAGHRRQRRLCRRAATCSRRRDRRHRP